MAMPGGGAMQALGRLRGAAADLWRRDPLAGAILLSVLLHGVVLMLRFAPPEALKFKPIDPQIEVVLLNARTDARPLKPEVAAQVNMEGGGDRDHGRARSPLPAELRAEDGDDLVRRRQRLAELEEQQRKLMAMMQGPQMPTRNEPALQPTRTADGSDRQNIDAVVARLQAQIDRQISDYNKRPKRLTYGINAVGVSYARYVEDWAARIERIGTERYPPEARGRYYDSLIITVEIDAHGNVVDVVINRKSKHEVLNRAVRQIVYAGAPYERFTPEMAREGDILQIVRTWTFTNDSLETAAVSGDGAARK
ncbi:MAG: energy transducer TonB [Burkholderiales bacterium]|nr:energy transducer TonB [Burkholderiales bacterium]